MAATDITGQDKLVDPAQNNSMILKNNCAKGNACITICSIVVKILP